MSNTIDIFFPFLPLVSSSTSSGFIIFPFTFIFLPSWSSLNKGPIGMPNSIAFCLLNSPFLSVSLKKYPKQFISCFNGNASMKYFFLSSIFPFLTSMHFISNSGSSIANSNVCFTFSCIPFGPYIVSGQSLPCMFIVASNPPNPKKWSAWKCEMKILFIFK